MHGQHENQIRTGTLPHFMQQRNVAEKRQREFKLSSNAPMRTRSKKHWGGDKRGSGGGISLFKKNAQLLRAIRRNC